MIANIDRLGRRMDELGLDGLVATTAENLCYLTGIASVALELFPHAGQSYAVVSRDRLARPWFVSFRCEADQFLDAIPELAGAVAYGEFYREPAEVPLTQREQRLLQVQDSGPELTGSLDALIDTLRRAGLVGGRVAVDEEGIPPDLLAALREALPGTDIRPGAAVLRWTRKVKTAEEHRRIAAAAAAAERGIQAVAAAARPGMTEREMVLEFERAVVASGARPKFSLIKIGREAVAGQSLPTTVPLRRGDAIWFDVGCVLDGYWSDIARVCSLGEPSDKVARYYAAMLAGEQRAIAEARPGMSGKELFDITVEAVRAAGVPHYRRHHVGHGIGVEIYDPVLIKPDNTDIIEDGTVVNIETPYYEFGFGAVHVEDPFVVRAGGNEVLTTLTRELIVCD